MLNIVSNARISKFTTGPKKVVDNLIKGLEIIGYPYVVNKRLDACKRLWIHDDTAALWQIKNLPPEIKIVVGPNLFVKPSQVPVGLDLSRSIYLHPSRWAADFWRDFGFRQCPIESWPTGIDTQEFLPSSERKEFVLVYFKQRLPKELEVVEWELSRKKIRYKIIKYPAYTENEYKSLLKKSRYAIWLGRQESQGIALEECLATNTPILVWDVTSMGQWLASKKEMEAFTAEENAYPKATSAEYFNQDCGIKIKSQGELVLAIETMEAELNIFSPRKYILENLSLKKQARDFLEIYNQYFGLTFEMGLAEKILRPGKWQNDTMAFKSRLWAKDLAKVVIKTAKKLTSL